MQESVHGGQRNIEFAAEATQTNVVVSLPVYELLLSTWIPDCELDVYSRMNSLRLQDHALEEC